MITLHKISNDEELKELVKLQMMYFNDTSFIPMDFASSFISFKKGLSHGGYARIIRNNQEIIGWICAQKVKVSYSKYDILNQIMYCCLSDGIEALQALKLSHQGLVDYAEASKIPYVMSASSHFDEDNRLAIILEKLGWQRRGYLAVYKTSYAN